MKIIAKGVIIILTGAAQAGSVANAQPLAIGDTALAPAFYEPDEPLRPPPPPEPPSSPSRS